MIGSGEDGDVPFVVVPFWRPFVVVPFEAPFDTAIVVVCQVLSLDEAGLVDSIWLWLLRVLVVKRSSLNCARSTCAVHYCSSVRRLIKPWSRTLGFAYLTNIFPCILVGPDWLSVDVCREICGGAVMVFPKRNVGNRGRSMSAL